jgi:hypothetical protein
MAATQEEMATDYWAHFYFENPREAATEVTDDDFDLDEIMQKAADGDWEDI